MVVNALSLSGILDLGDGLQLQVYFLDFFVLVGIQNLYSVVGHSKGVFSVHEGLESSEVRAIFGLHDKGIIVEGFIILHLEYYIN